MIYNNDLDGDSLRYRTPEVNNFSIEPSCIICTSGAGGDDAEINEDPWNI